MSHLLLPCDIDFGRSFLRFSTTRINHTPRLNIDAACALISADGRMRRYYLTSTCIGEEMYVPSGLIHEPVSEFNLIAAPNEQFLLLKRHACAEHDVRSAHRFGETMPTRDGKGATVVELSVSLARFSMVAPIKSYRDFRMALLENHPINGRTIFADEDGTTTIVAEYPVRTGNVGNDREVWQVDAGPIIIPSYPATGDLDVARFEIAFIVYNRWDYAEAVLRGVVPFGAEAASGRTNYYSVRRNLRCRNELFFAV